jgi:hypothetical protein
LGSFELSFQAIDLRGQRHHPLFGPSPVDNRWLTVASKDALTAAIVTTNHRSVRFKVSRPTNRAHINDTNYATLLLS